MVTLRLIKEKVMSEISDLKAKVLAALADCQEAVEGLFGEASQGEDIKPTTLAGYGITDAYTKAEVDERIKAAIDSLVCGDSAGY